MTNCNPLRAPHPVPFFPVQATKWREGNAVAGAIRQTPCLNPAGSGAIRCARWYKPAPPIAPATYYPRGSSQAHSTPETAVYCQRSVNRYFAGVPDKFGPTAPEPYAYRGQILARSDFDQNSR